MQRPLAAGLPLRTLVPPRGARGVLRAPGRLLARGWASRRARVTIVCATVAATLLFGGYLWFRGSSFVAVSRVSISGVHGPQAAEIESALRSAGRRMSTLQVNLAALRAAVAAFPVVREVRASASFPHTLNVRVIEQLPVAALLAGGSRTAVAADGAVLGPALLSAGLPTVSASFDPATGQRVEAGAVREALAVLGAAPRALAGQIARAFSAKEGLTLAMRNGLQVLFGDASRAHAKWRALETVLADEGSAGASYIDVRVPERPAAGGFAAGAPPLSQSAGAQASSPGTAQNGAGSSVEAIAEALRSNPGVGTGPPATGGPEHSEEHQAGASSGGEAAAPSTNSGGEEAAPPASAPAGAGAGAGTGEAARASGGAGAPEGG